MIFTSFLFTQLNGSQLTQSSGRYIIKEIVLLRRIKGGTENLNLFSFNYFILFTENHSREKKQHLAIAYQTGVRSRKLM